jgi:hypothetical protein
MTRCKRDENIADVLWKGVAPGAVKAKPVSHALREQYARAVVRTLRRSG